VNDDAKPSSGVRIAFGDRLRLVYGPVSDRFGRKPVVVFGVALFVVASLACAAAQSLPELLICRFVQGVGAASTAMTFAIIRDLSDTARMRGSPNGCDALRRFIRPAAKPTER
jgi:MFS family permease